MDTFSGIYRNWANIATKYDLLDFDPRLPHFNREKCAFDKTSDEYQRRLATQFDLAFDQCVTTTQCTTLIQMLGTIMHRPIIMNELKPRYNDVIRLFSTDMDLVKVTFDQGVKNINEHGFFALPLDSGQPPIAGTLKWVNKLRARLLLPASNFPYLDYE